MTNTVTLARPYARAIFDYAKGQQALADWSVRLANCCLLIADVQVVKLLKNPNVSREHIKKFIQSLASAGIDELSCQLLLLLEAHQRLLLISEITALYERYRQAWERKITVHVTTAFPMSSDFKEKFNQALAMRLERTVDLQYVIDNSLLGGAIVRADDLVIDGSVKSRLVKLQQVLES